MNEKSRNLVNYFQTVPQVTLYVLHCNITSVLPKPKHAATIYNKVISLIKVLLFQTVIEYIPTSHNVSCSPPH